MLPSGGILRLIISGWSYMIMYNVSIIKIMLNSDFNISQRMLFCVRLAILLFLSLPIFIRSLAENVITKKTLPLLDSNVFFL